MNEFSPNTISNRIDKYIITVSIVNNAYPSYPYMFITENCFSKIMIMSFWSPAPKFKQFFRVRVFNNLITIIQNPSIINDIQMTQVFPSIYGK